MTQEVAARQMDPKPGRIIHGRTWNQEHLIISL
jgi:hypothetical protein